MSRLALALLATVLTGGTLTRAAHPHRARVFTIVMTHDSTGQHFAPSDLDVFTGDTLRFVNAVGHHNVDFVRDSNPPGAPLPAKTPVAEKSGDVFVVPVTLPPGRYVFQCDPHATMGMVGHLRVAAPTR